jgi:hypothetical protein
VPPAPNDTSTLSPQAAATVPAPPPDPVDASASAAATQATHIGADPNESAKPFATRLTEGIGQEAKDQVQDFLPPQDHKEVLAFELLGPGGLLAYRASKEVAAKVTNLVSGKSTTADYNQAKSDLIHSVQDFHAKKYGQGLADTTSLASDAVGSLMPGVSPVSDRLRAFAQGAKPGGNLAGAVGKTATDVAGLAIGNEAVEAASEFEPEETRFARAKNITPPAEPADHITFGSIGGQEVAPPTKTIDVSPISATEPGATGSGAEGDVRKANEKTIPSKALQGLKKPGGK